MKFIASAVGLLLSLLSLPKASADTLQTFTLEERLAYEWKHEAILIEFKADRGRCHRGGALLKRGDQAVLSQTTDVRYWSQQKKWIRSARLLFFTSLRPNQRKKYSLVCHTQPHHHFRDHGMKISIQNDTLSVVTDQLHIVFPMSSFKAPKGRENTEVPAPFSSLKVRHRKGYKNWGKAIWYGKRKLFGFQSTILERGPLLTKVRLTYRYRHATSHITASVYHHHSHVSWHSRIVTSTRHRLSPSHHGWALAFPPTPLQWFVFPEGYSPWMRRWLRKDQNVGRYALVPIRSLQKKRIAQLTPWRDWFNSRTQTHWTLRSSQARFEVASQNSHIWQNPLPIGRIKNPWILANPGLPVLFKTPKGSVQIRLPLAPGQRAWSWGSPRRTLRFRLNKVRKQILLWPSKQKHPRLFTSPIAWNKPTTTVSARAQKQLSQSAQYWARFRKKYPAHLPFLKQALGFASSSGISPARRGLRAYLAHPSKERGQQARLDRYLEFLLDVALKLGAHKRHVAPTLFDFFRIPPWLIRLYDFVIHGGWISPQMQQRLRSKMAAFAYLLEDSQVWSSERGYNTGNLDMHYGYNMNRGLLGILLQDHPRAALWRSYGSRWMEHYLSRLGPKGEPHENSHYSITTLVHLTGFLSASQQNRLPHVLHRPKWKQQFRYFLQSYTPPDPRFRSQRALASWGRSSNGYRPFVFGVYARLYRNTDPTLSAQLQAIWKASGASKQCHALTLEGIERLLVNDNLPSRAPRLSSYHNKTFTAFRSGYNQRHEHALFLKHKIPPHHSHFDGGNILSLFAYGQPISSVFTAQFSHHLRANPLLSKVVGSYPWWTKARKRPYNERFQHLSTAFDSFSWQDSLHLCMKRKGFGPFYPAHTYPKRLPRWPRTKTKTNGNYKWCRQVLFVKDTNPRNVHYYVIRDTILGNQPTHWLMWTLTQGLSPHHQKQRKALPPYLPTRQLPQSSRYTGVGQFGVDVDYFITSPTQTPRYTTRWTSKMPKNYNNISEGLRDTQDALILSLPKGGAYHVVIFPRRLSNPPKFKSLGEGHIVKRSGPSGVDYTFLSQRPRTFQNKSILFQGTAASIQHRIHRTTLALASQGEVRYLNYQLAGSASCATWTGQTVQVEVTPGRRPIQLRIASPQTLKLTQADRRRGVLLQQARSRPMSYKLTLPIGVKQVVLHTK